MRTLVVSDLHLGSCAAHDVLRRGIALDALLGAVRDADRLVLLGDVVELIEGRPGWAMRIAEPVVRAIGDAVGKGCEVIVVPGNHDHALARPWLRAQARRGRRTAPATRVPIRATARLTQLAAWLKPARVSVRYPGVWLADGVYATHGHYVDRHLVPAKWGARLHGPFAPIPARRARVEDYERTAGPYMASVSSALAVTLPRALGDVIDTTTGLIRRATVPVGGAMPDTLAPALASALDLRFRRIALPAMAQVIARLHVRAHDVIFGHLHRPGPLPGDAPGEWTFGDLRLHNAGSWVFEPLLVGSAHPPHPYWPGGAVIVDGERILTVALLDHVQQAQLCERAA
jgi:UDP-2,3-diacylglucosamine pyrophosphatase LpxH